MLEQAMSKITLFKSSRPGELAEVVTEAGSSGEGRGEGVATGSTDATAGGGREGEPRVGSLDDYDGIVTVGGDGTLHEVFLLVRPGRNGGFKGCLWLVLGRACWNYPNVLGATLSQYSSTHVDNVIKAESLTDGK